MGGGDYEIPASNGVREEKYLFPFILVDSQLGLCNTRQVNKRKALKLSIVLHPPRHVPKFFVHQARKPLSCIFFQLPPLPRPCLYPLSTSGFCTGLSLADQTLQIPFGATSEIPRPPVSPLTTPAGLALVADGSSTSSSFLKVESSSFRLFSLEDLFESQRFSGSQMLMNLQFISNPESFLELQIYIFHRLLTISWTSHKASQT